MLEHTEINTSYPIKPNSIQKNIFRGSYIFELRKKFAIRGAFTTLSKIYDTVVYEKIYDTAVYENNRLTSLQTLLYA